MTAKLVGHMNLIVWVYRLEEWRTRCVRSPTKLPLGLASLGSLSSVIYISLLTE